jgi:hypothetical protein
VVVDTLSDEHEITSFEEPIADPPLSPPEALLWIQKTGWISWRRSDLRSVRMCWLPHERRGEPFASHDMTAVIGAHDGTVTILDFSEVISMLNTVV